MKKFRNVVCGLLFVQLLSAQTPQQLKSYLPSLAGWQISDSIEVFNPENLFTRINGAAPLFIENNFREMTSLEYVKENDYITIQAYRHATPVDAFGMYASERSSEGNFLPIGGEADGYDYALYFFAGSMYVKISSNNSDDGMAKTLQTIGAGFAKKIDPKADYPATIKKFPKEGKVPYTEAYITSNYLGHTFLTSVYTSDYKKNENEFQVFVVDGKTKEGAKEILQKYIAFTKQSIEPTEGNIVIEDKYNGNIPCIWKGQYIIGIFNEDGKKLNEDNLLKELTQKLQQ